MGQILKKDFDGEDLNKKIHDNPDKAYYFESFLKDADYSDLKLDGLSPEEMLKIGKDHCDGENDREWDISIAKKYYQASAERGCIEAMIELAFQYKRAVFPFYTKALYWYKKAAEIGSSRAKCCIGQMYEEGEGVEQDYKQAVYWYEEAGKGAIAKGGDNEGKRNFFSPVSQGLSRAGMIYYHGQEGMPRDRVRAAECFRKAAVSGDGVSNFYLGLMYLSSGDTQEQDYEKAFSCFEIAAGQGYYAPLDCIDYMYETGKIKNGKYKSAALWFTASSDYVKAANQLGYILTDSENFAYEMSDYHKQTISALPEGTWLYRAILNNEKSYEKGIFWYECAAEALCQKSFFQLILLYIHNRDHGINKPPGAEKIAYFVNKMYPPSEDSAKITFNQKDCDELIGKFISLSDCARKEGLLSIGGLMENEQNVFLKTGLSLAVDGTDTDIIKVIIENMLETDKKEGIDRQARNIITQGIVSVQQGESRDVLKMKLYDICGADITALEKEWKNSSKSENAENYFERGRIFYKHDNLDAAIADFQRAVDFSEDSNEREHFRSWIVKACSEKQRTQTLDEIMAPFVLMIEKIKNSPPKSIGAALDFKTDYDYTDFCAALALFEEYELLKRLIDEAAGSPLFTQNRTLLNAHVRPQIVSWGPTPLYFITTKMPLKKMKDPKKMLRFLTENGADINALAADSSTALINQTCGDCESTEILKTLLDLGADPDLTSLFGDNVWTPLVHCLCPKYVEDDDAYHPFDDFAINQAKVILEHNADPNLINPDIPDNPPLTLAIKFGFITKGGPTMGKPASGIMEFIEFLIKKGADINFVDPGNNTPMSIAKENNLTAVEELLAKYKMV